MFFNKISFFNNLFFSGKGNRALVERLVEKGTDIHSADGTGQTALHIAAQKGHLAIFEKLIEKEASVNTADQDGKTALHWAAHKGRLNILESLLVCKIDVNVPDKEGKAALHWAVQTGHLAIVRKLMEKEASANAADQEGKTVLQWAAQNDHLAIIVQRLVGRRDNFYQAGVSGQIVSHLDFMARQGYSQKIETVQYLIRKGTEVSNIAKYLSLFYWELRFLLECGYVYRPFSSKAFVEDFNLLISEGRIDAALVETILEHYKKNESLVAKDRENLIDCLEKVLFSKGEKFFKDEVPSSVSLIQQWMRLFPERERVQIAERLFEKDIWPAYVACLRNSPEKTLEQRELVSWMGDKILAMFEWLPEEKKSYLVAKEAYKENLLQEEAGFSFLEADEAIKSWVQSKYSEGLEEEANNSKGRRVNSCP